MQLQSIIIAIAFVIIRTIKMQICDASLSYDIIDSDMYHDNGLHRWGTFGSKLNTDATPSQESQIHIMRAQHAKA